MCMYIYLRLLVEQCTCRKDVSGLVLCFKGAQSRFVHIETFSLNFSNSSFVIHVIIKFPYNTRSDWLKERALSENRARVDDGKLAFKFLLRNFDKFDPN